MAHYPPLTIRNLTLGEFRRWLQNYLQDRYSYDFRYVLIESDVKKAVEFIHQADESKRRLVKLMNKEATDFEPFDAVSRRKVLQDQITYRLWDQCVVNINLNIDEAEDLTISPEIEFEGAEEQNNSLLSQRADEHITDLMRAVVNKFASIKTDSLTETPAKFEQGEIEKPMKRIRSDRIKPIALAICFSEVDIQFDKLRDAARRFGTTTKSVNARRNNPKVKDEVKRMSEDREYRYRVRGQVINRVSARRQQKREKN